jgi:SM-20-related protein
MIMDSSPTIELARHDQLERMREIYRRAGRIHIAPALSDASAHAIYRSLTEEVPWQLHLNDGERSYDLAEEQIKALPEPNRVLLHDRLMENAATRFQYLFDNFPLSDAAALGRHKELVVMRVFEFLNSSPFLEFARAVTGEQRIQFADAQATRYRPGHFLTQHDDSEVKAERIAAYVLNLTPAWRADWGGVLQFLDREGHVIEGYKPVFNALNLFRVPQPHSVSYVTPFARAARFSISGWLRSR